MATASADSLRLALSCFLTTNDGEAGRFLEAFQQAPESWGICLSLLQSAPSIQPGADSALLLFCAQTLRHKVETQIPGADSSVKQTVQASLFSLLPLLSSQQSLRQVLLQVCRALGALFLLTPGACNGLETRLAGTPLPPWAMLDLFRVLAEDCADVARTLSHVNPQRRHQYSNELVQHSPSLAQLLSHVQGEGIQGRINPSHVSECLLAWVRIGFWGVIIQGENGSTVENILSLMLTSLQMPAHVDAAAEVLGESACLHPEALLPRILGGVLTSLSGVCGEMMSRQSGESVSESVQECLVPWACLLNDLGTASPPMLTSAGGVGDGALSAWCSASLRLMSVKWERQREVILALMGAWSALGDVAGASPLDSTGPPSLIRMALTQSLSLVLHASQVESKGEEWEADEEMSGVCEFRDQIEEMLSDVCHALGCQHYLAQVLRPIQSTGNEGPAVSLSAAESSLFACLPAVRETCAEEHIPPATWQHQALGAVLQLLSHVSALAQPVLRGGVSDQGCLCAARLALKTSALVVSELGVHLSSHLPSLPSIMSVLATGLTENLSSSACAQAVIGVCESGVLNTQGEGEGEGGVCGVSSADVAQIRGQAVNSLLQVGQALASTRMNSVQESQILSAVGSATVMCLSPQDLHQALFTTLLPTLIMPPFQTSPGLLALASAGGAVLPPASPVPLPFGVSKALDRLSALCSGVSSALQHTPSHTLSSLSPTTSQLLHSTWCLSRAVLTSASSALTNPNSQWEGSPEAVIGQLESVCGAAKAVSVLCGSSGFGFQSDVMTHHCVETLSLLCSLLHSLPHSPPLSHGPPTPLQGHVSSAAACILRAAQQCIRALPHSSNNTQNQQHTPTHTHTHTHTHAHAHALRASILAVLRSPCVRGSFTPPHQEASSLSGARVDLGCHVLTSADPDLLEGLFKFGSASVERLSEEEAKVLSSGTETQNYSEQEGRGGEIQVAECVRTLLLLSLSGASQAHRHVSAAAFGLVHSVFESCINILSFLAHSNTPLHNLSGLHCKGAMLHFIGDMVYKGGGEGGDGSGALGPIVMHRLLITLQGPGSVSKINKTLGAMQDLLRVLWALQEFNLLSPHSHSHFPSDPPAVSTLRHWTVAAAKQADPNGSQEEQEKMAHALVTSLALGIQGFNLKEPGSHKQSSGVKPHDRVLKKLLRDLCEGKKQFR